MDRRTRFSRPVAALLAGMLLAALAGCKSKPATSRPTEPAAPPDTTAADRQTSQNNLKQIGIAFHNHHATFNFLPVGYVDAKTGRPGLSWRVAILPFIEEVELYQQFKLDEPWDSPHNKKLLAKMPKLYAPVRGDAPEGYTFYQGFATHVTGPKGQELPPKMLDGPTPFASPSPALFPDPRFRVNQPINPGPQGTPIRGRRLTEIIDGTSNTFLVAEAGEAVPWTKPQDIPVSSNRPIPKLGGMFDGDYSVVFCDGSVRLVRKGVPEKALRDFISPDDGNSVDPDLLDGSGSASGRGSIFGGTPQPAAKIPVPPSKGPPKGATPPKAPLEG